MRFRPPFIGNRIGLLPRSIRRGGAAAGPPPLPFSEKLYARYRASSPALGAVAQWNDETAAARHLIQGTAAAQPLAREYNGVRSLRLDGGDSFPLPAGFSLNSRSVTVFAVRRTVHNGPQVYFHLPSATTGLAFDAYQGTSAPGPVRIYDGGFKTSSLRSSHSVEVLCWHSDGTGSRILHGREENPLALLTNRTETGGWVFQWANGTEKPNQTDVYDMPVFTGMTLAEARQVYDYLVSEHDALSRTADCALIAEGDSTFHLTTDILARDYNPIRQLEIRRAGRLKMVNNGSGGKQLSVGGLAANVPEDLGAWLLASAAYPKLAGVLNLGINDMHNGVSVATTEANYAAWANRIRTGAGAQGANVKLVLCIIQENTFNNQANMTALRASARANYASWGFQGIADFAADPRINNVNDPLIYSADKTHMLPAGEVIKGEIIDTALAAVGAA